MSEQFDFESLLKKAKFRAMAAMNECRETYQTYQRRKYEIIGVAIAAAKQLGSIDQQYNQFSNDPFWRGHRALNRKALLSHVLMYIYGSHQKAEAERARRHAKALRQFFESSQPPSKVPDFIENSGGLEALYKTSKGSKRADDDVNENEESGDDEEDDVEPRKKPTSKTASKTQSSGDTRKQSGGDRVKQKATLEKLAMSLGMLAVESKGDEIFDDLADLTPGKYAIWVQVRKKRADDFIPVEAIKWAKPKS